MCALCKIFGGFNLFPFICNCRFPCELYLNRHLKNKHNTSKGYTCNLCGLVTRTPKAMQRHNRKVHLPRVPEQCNYCGNLYATRASLTQHMLNMHVLVNKEHRCEICGFVSSTKDAKRKHIEFRHNPTKNHKCSMCGKAFKTPTLLKVCIDRILSNCHWYLPCHIFPVGTYSHSHGNRFVQVWLLWSHF